MKCWICGEEVKAGDDLVVRQAPWSTILETRGVFTTGEWPYAHEACSEGYDDYSDMVETVEIVPGKGHTKTWTDNNPYRVKAHETFMKYGRGP